MRSTIEITDDSVPLFVVLRKNKKQKGKGSFNDKFLKGTDWWKRSSCFWLNGEKYFHEGKKSHGLCTFASACMSYSPARIWYLYKIIKHPRSVSLTTEKTTHCLPEPKNRLIQHWPTLCRSSRLHLSSPSASIWTRRTTALTGPGTISRSYTRGVQYEWLREMSLHFKKKRIGY